MQNTNINGVNGLASRTSTLAFDCATNFYERGVVYDDMTAENLNKWFRETKFKYTLEFMGREHLKAQVRKTADGFYARIFQYDHFADQPVTDEQVTFLGKRMTTSKWEELISLIEKYVDDMDAEAELQKEWDANEIVCEYQNKIDELAEDHKGHETPIADDIAALEKARDIYEEYLNKIGELYNCECGVGDGFGLDLSSLGDEFFPGTTNIGWEEMQWQYDHLYDRIEEVSYQLEYASYEA